VQPALNGTRKKGHFVRERLYQGTHTSLEALGPHLRTRVLALLFQQQREWGRSPDTFPAAKKLPLKTSCTYSMSTHAPKLRALRGSDEVVAPHAPCVIHYGYVALHCNNLGLAAVCVAPPCLSQLNDLVV